MHHRFEGKRDYTRNAWEDLGLEMRGWVEEINCRFSRFVGFFFQLRYVVFISGDGLCKSLPVMIFRSHNS